MATSIRLSSLSCLLLLALHVRATALRLAQPVPQIYGREDFQGGFAIGLDGTQCPSDVSVECTGSISNPACCPAGTTCKGYYQYCCPTSEDCRAIVGNFPKCADASWTLYAVEPVNNYYFCCPPGQFGVLPLTGYGGFCKPDGEIIAASRIAVKANAGATTIETTTRTTKTVTSISTATDGSVKTITIVTTGQATIIKTELTNDPTGVRGNSGSSSQSASPSSSSSGQSPQNSAAISTGTIAGIAVGGLGVLAIFALAFVLYGRRRPNMGGAVGQTPAPDYAVYAPAPQLQDISNYLAKSPSASYAGVSTAVGTPGVDSLSPPPSGYGPYGPPPPPTAEVQGHNSWDGRAEIGNSK